MPMPSNSAGIVSSCAFLARVLAASSAISVARLQASWRLKRPSPGRCNAPARPVRSSSVSGGFKLYSFHAPEGQVHRLGKERVPHKRRIKVSIPPTNARALGSQFVPHAAALPGNSCDSHTLRATIEAVERLTGRTKKRLRQQRFPPSRSGKAAAHLHPRAEAWRVRPLQARTPSPFRRLGRD